MNKRRFRLDVARDSACAEHAFRAMNYTGTDGAIVWRAACWVNVGAITQAQFGDAYEGVRVIRPRKPIAYFRAILKDTLGEARLTDLERRTSLPRGFIAGPMITDAGDRHRNEGEPPHKPEHLSSVLERSMKRLTERRAPHDA